MGIPSMMFVLPAMSFIMCNIPLGGSTWPTLIGQALKPGSVCGHDGVTYPNYIIAFMPWIKKCYGKCPCNRNINGKDACDESPGVKGPCRAGFPRWTFIKETGKCKKFTYGGCLGNGNRFQSADECISTCGATGTSKFESQAHNRTSKFGGCKTLCQTEKCCDGCHAKLATWETESPDGEWVTMEALGEIIRIAEKAKKHGCDLSGGVLTYCQTTDACKVIKRKKANKFKPMDFKRK